MEIDYTTQDGKLSEQELELLQQAENDIKDFRVYPYTNHRDILGR